MNLIGELLNHKGLANICHALDNSSYSKDNPITQTEDLAVKFFMAMNLFQSFLFFFLHSKSHAIVEKATFYIPQ